MQPGELAADDSTESAEQTYALRGVLRVVFEDLSTLSVGRIGEVHLV